MSVIAFKILDNKIQVAFDGRCLSDDRIISENYIKAHKISDSLIIGVTGLSDTTCIFKKFVEDNQQEFENTNNSTDFIPLMKDFREFIIDNYGYSIESVSEFGGFLVVNKQFHGVFYYDEKTYFPYCVYDNFDKVAFGSSGTYTTALIENGIELEDAIKRSAKKYSSINDNVTILEIEK